MGDAAAIGLHHPLVEPGVELVDPCRAELNDLGELHARPPVQGFASRTMLNGVSATRRNVVKPALVTMSRSRASPAWAPSAAPTSWDSELGVQSSVENP